MGTFLEVTEGKKGVAFAILCIGLILNVLLVIAPIKFFFYAIFGIALVVLVWVNPLLVLLFIMLIRMSNVQIPAVSIGMIEIGFNKILGGFLMVILLCESILRRNLNFIRPWQTKLGFSFLLIAFISALQAQERSEALSTIIIYSMSFFIYILMITLVKTGGQINLVIRTLIASGILLIVLEVLAMWGFIPYLVLPEDDEYRFGSFFAQPNDLAIHLAFLTPLLAYVVIRSRSRFAKALGTGVFTIFTLAIFLTGSRSGLITFAFTILLLCVFNRRSRWLSGRSVRLWLTGVVVLVMLVVFIPAEQKMRFATLETILGGSTSIDSGIALRFDLIEVALKVFLQHPLLGVGPANYYHQTQGYGMAALSAHNVYAAVLAETGIMGFFVYVLIYATMFFDLRKAKTLLGGIDPELQYTAESVFISFIVMFVGRMAYNDPFDTLLVLMMGLSVVLMRIVTASITEPAQP